MYSAPLQREAVAPLEEQAEHEACAVALRHVLAHARLAPQAGLEVLLRNTRSE